MSEGNFLEPWKDLELEDDNESDEVLLCGICGELHPIKHDRRGREFVTLGCMGSGSNVFPRTPFGARIFYEWKKDAVEKSRKHGESSPRSGRQNRVPGRRKIEILGMYLQIRQRKLQG